MGIKNQFKILMRNTLITLAVAATTAYARELQSTTATQTYGADMLWMLEQRDSCLWQCKTAKCGEFPDYSGYNCYHDRRRQISDEFEICFDTCYPELSRCRWI